MLTRARSLALAVTIGAHAALAHAATEEPSLAQFSAMVDRQWDYAKPAESEQRFRALLEQWPPGDPQALIIATQIARTESLRRRFAAAHAALDAVEGSLDGAPSHVRVRYLLERGRTFNSAGAPERAVPLFAQALSLAECNDDAFYAVDAAHMLGIAAPPGARLDWNLKALAMSEGAAAPRVRRWLAPLYNNIGQAYIARGDAAGAKPWAAKAHAALKDDPDLSAGEPARLARLGAIAAGTPPAAKP